MKITYVARSFLDYRVPVLAELDRLSQGRLSFIYSADYVPERCQDKLRLVLGPKAMGLHGEKRIGPNEITGFANKKLRLVYQPGVMRAIKSTTPDVLIGDGFYQWTSFGLAYSIFLRVPLVLCYERTFHTERNAQWYRTAYRRLVMKFIDAMAVNGQLCRDYAESLGMPSKRVTTGQMVADTEGLIRRMAKVTSDARSHLRSQLEISGLAFLFVGRLIELKGLTQLLNAWVDFEKTHPGQATLILVGSGPLEASLKAQCAELGLSSVRFPGKVDYDAIAPYYAASDVFVMPTLEDNWSLVVPEAMACGLPILCSKYNGCFPELVKEGVNGWVFDPLSEQSLSQALRNCLENRERLSAMGQQSKAIVAGHTPTHAAEAIFKACHLAIAPRNRK